MNGSGSRLYARAIALTALLSGLALYGCTPLHFGPPPDYFWTVHSHERSDADRITDQNWRPEKLLEFWGVWRGMRVADLGAGDGYFAELLARIVGPRGVVYAQSSPADAARHARAYSARAKKRVMANVVHVVRDVADPLPPEARELDLVTASFYYHKLVAAEADRARMNRAVFAALKSGGIYAVSDYAGPPGAGAAEARRLGRVDKALVRREVEAAGFRLADEAQFLESDVDPHDVPVASLGGRADAFVWKFVKP